eukprot:CAMPEP_0117647748 /NCGR_PEP_ID=MMETSP0804-20121206/10_1 /TAXON_ID=1074897 /ORGANISM="Tetraselmis astigmatica, Strain CCMP880" /LENGTH=195 /DNA_ID=CAMNT_0005453251 /DNA_START=205 /DNA_END=792 /DNA_ORIENTATION=+
MSTFFSIYAGLFDNSAAAEAEPGKVQFASKFHHPLSLPWLGEHCFYVHEKTMRGGQMTYRLRLAVLSSSQAQDGGFVATHYQFDDEETVKGLTGLPQEECPAVVLRMAQPKVSRVEGGDVVFKKREGEDVWDVETSYGDTCRDGSRKDAPPPAFITHVQGSLSQQGWQVKVVAKRSADGAVVHTTELELDRVLLS